MHYVLGGDIMQVYSMPRNIWRAVYPVLIFLGISFFVVFAVMVGYAFHLAVEIAVAGDVINQASIEQRLMGFVTEFGMLIQLIAGVLTVAFFVLMWRKVRTRIPQFENNKLTPLLIVLAVLGFAGLNIFLAVVFAATDIYRHFPSYAEVAQALMGGSFMMRVLALGIAAPIAEELCCRGVVFNRLNSWAPSWVAVLVSSALFALMHMDLLQGMYAFAVGVLFCILYIRYRNLWIPIIGHIAFNMANVVLVEAIKISGVEEMNALALLIPSLLITAVCTVLMIKRTKPAIPAKPAASDAPAAAIEAAIE